MGRFGPDPQAFFEAVYRAEVPWDIGDAQPAMAALVADYPPVGPILDVGCGSGDLAIHLVRLGYEVVGVDFVEAAIAEANKRRAALPPETARLLSFRVADALQLSVLGKQFGSVVDSGFMHLLGPVDTDRYVHELEHTLISGGRLYLLEFAVEFPADNVPRAVTEEEVRLRFQPDHGWRVLEIRSAEFLSTVAPPVPAIAACVERI